MSLILSVDNITSQKGSKRLFSDLSLGIFQGDRIGLMGPNGAGKSSLLKLLAGIDSADEGDVHANRGLRVSYVAQSPQMPSSPSVFSYMKEHLLKLGYMSEIECDVATNIYLGKAEFLNFDIKVGELSGGWQKRLNVACALASEPDLLLLDEPTNHMDWDSIIWLESMIRAYRKSFVLVSHDRDFLQNLVTRCIEINPMYEKGYLSIYCAYNDFLIKKEEYVSSLSQLQSSMSNKARREVEWLRAGVKARTTKSQSRIKEAHQLLEDLDSVKKRNSAGNARSRIEIDSSGQRRKKLIELKKLDVGYEETPLIKNLNMTFGSRTRIGILGGNGSGKTTLLKTINGEVEALAGEVFLADDLKLVYFEQSRESLPLDQTLFQYLGGGGDYANLHGEPVHVASYLSRFLFFSDQMHFPIERLSGGEKARLLIAKLLLQSADVLLLDEPTNDLDIETIEILEEKLREFDGLLILVSHDRRFMSNVCQKFLAVEGDGVHTTYADIGQWLKNYARNNAKNKDATVLEKSSESERPKAKLSYQEKQRLNNMEAELAELEVKLKTAQQKLEDKAVLSNHEKLREISSEIQKLEAQIENLYVIWSDLEIRK